MQPLSKEAAQDIALSGFQYLAGDDDLLMRFSGTTGILPNDMREAASEPGFWIGVLDFFLAHEPDLLKWAEECEINPEHIAPARHALAPDDMSGFS